MWEAHSNGYIYWGFKVSIANLTLLCTTETSQYHFGILKMLIWHLLFSAKEHSGSSIVVLTGHKYLSLTHTYILPYLKKHCMIH